LIHHPLTHMRIIVPSSHCSEEVIDIIARDPMGNCYTYLRERGYETLALDPREGHPEQVISALELTGEEALRILCQRGGMLSQRAHEFLEQQFGHVYLIYLSGGAKLFYIQGLDVDESQLLVA
jgi:hypothetical protein